MLPIELLALRSAIQCSSVGHAIQTPPPMDLALSELHFSTEPIFEPIFCFFPPILTPPPPNREITNKQKLTNYTRPLFKVSIFTAEVIPYQKHWKRINTVET